MADPSATAALTGGVALLERAIGYTLGCLHQVTPEAMSRPTPCRRWDLRELLRHIDDSFLALQEAIDIGHIDVDPAAGDNFEGDPVTTLKDRACRLLGAWTHFRGRDPVSVAGCPLSASIVTSAGAVEVAVHGWDVAAACGHRRPIPPELATDMLELTPLFVTAADRPVRFAAPVEIHPPATPGDRLVAFLGRTP